MEFEEYRVMFEAEDTHWWYRGLRGAIFTLLSLDRAPRHRVRILDAGCGTGGNMAGLRAHGFTQVDGCDFSETAISFCHARGLKNVYRSSLTEMPFADDTYDIVISCDVVSDAGIKSDAEALAELYRVLKPGGRLFLNLPALKMLTGEHDRATSIARRYTAREIAEKLEKAGFEMRRVTYRTMLLFPLVLAVRLARPDKGQAARSDISVPPAPINALLTGIMRLEQLLLRRPGLPIGSSVSVVARKPG